ncbi:hypothetical protein [Rhodothermus profundi]|uniref:Uncharacterized protein n=1 Tax=Rhodothermus profundi TaxID=633813 RepID=A0A1M6XQ24_9BACT|nr:hypothetical protein [Rhodothermus profundi]SHL07978.1 hypothetical protein SAMN04488087_2660 [Rhodothermus profundi]
MRRLLLLLSLFFWSSRTPAAAQPTNLERFQELARTCLALPDTLQAFRLEAPDTLPYLRVHLEAHWLQEQRQVYFGDTLRLPTLRYRIEAARVAYARLDAQHLQRTVTLALRYELLSPDGRLLDVWSCQPVAVDTVAQRLLPHLEHPAFPETQAPLPPERPGLLERYVLPAVALVATTLSIYLLFTLRSRSGDAPRP